tara:strand:- start:105 stop:275 length:171 start_codon:yes stop_codon:yes gene_type:complete
MVGFRELKFASLHVARKRAKSFKRVYGYTPQVFKITDPITGRTKYVIVRPSGLSRI